MWGMMLLLLAAASIQHATATQQPCAGGAIEISLDSACASGSPANNNLGGDGPGSGPEEIRYANVGTLHGRSFDLVLRSRLATFGVKRK